MGRTAPLTSKRSILYIYSTTIDTEYFKHALYSPSFSLQNAVCFLMLTCLVPVLFTFHIQGVLKLKKNNSGAKGLMGMVTLRFSSPYFFLYSFSFHSIFQFQLVFQSYPVAPSSLASSIRLSTHFAVQITCLSIL